MNVIVVDRGTSKSYTGFRLRHIEIADTCPVCGGPRGEPRLSRYCEDGEWYQCHNWDNPCGHIDMYDAVLREAKKVVTQ